MQAVVDGLLTNYTKTGTSKKVVILLHGWGDSLKTYQQLSKELGTSYTVICLDLPGFGGTQAPDGVWGLDEYAAFVHDFLNKQNIKTVYAFIGHSNGGAVLIRGLANKHITADKLVLLSAAGIRTAQKGQRLVIKAIAKTGKVATFWLPDHHKKKLQKKLYGTVGSDMLVVPHLQETFKKTVRQDVQQDAGKLTLPTLLLYGENDKATPPLYGEMYHQLIANSTFEIVGEAGHFVHQDQPVAVLAAIEGFLK
jgi:pimeloyl-ACP methyl ester carboxylesterase